MMVYTVVDDCVVGDEEKSFGELWEDKVVQKTRRLLKRGAAGYQKKAPAGDDVALIFTSFGKTFKYMDG